MSGLSSSSNNLASRCFPFRPFGFSLLVGFNERVIKDTRPRLAAVQAPKWDSIRFLRPPGSTPKGSFNSRKATLAFLSVTALLSGSRRVPFVFQKLAVAFVVWRWHRLFWLAVDPNMRCSLRPYSRRVLSHIPQARSSPFPPKKCTGANPFPPPGMVSMRIFFFFVSQ